jgi:hypothetical protein
LNVEWEKFRVFGFAFPLGWMEEERLRAISLQINRQNRWFEVPLHASQTASKGVTSISFKRTPSSKFLPGQIGAFRQDEALFMFSCHRPEQLAQPRSPRFIW